MMLCIYSFFLVHFFAHDDIDGWIDNPLLWLLVQRQHHQRISCRHGQWSSILWKRTKYKFSGGWYSIHSKYLKFNEINYPSLFWNKYLGGLCLYILTSKCYPWVISMTVNYHNNYRYLILTYRYTRSNSLSNIYYLYKQFCNEHKVLLCKKSNISNHHPF